MSRGRMPGLTCTDADSAGPGGTRAPTAGPVMRSEGVTELPNSKCRRQSARDLMDALRRPEGHGAF